MLKTWENKSENVFQLNFNYNVKSIIKVGYNIDKLNCILIDCCVGLMFSQTKKFSLQEISCHKHNLQRILWVAQE